MQLMSFGSFLSLATGSPYKFAIIYSMGNVIALTGYVLLLCRTGFLTGFAQQFKNMVDEERRLTTLVFASSLAGCFVFSLIF